MPRYRPPAKTTIRLGVAAFFAIYCLEAKGYSDTSMVNEREAALAFIELHEFDKMPDGFQLGLGICTTDECVGDQARTLIATAGAYAKDYGDQRNLSYCLSTGCDLAITQNTTLGCAWRIVILASGSPEVDSTDILNREVYCEGHLDEFELATAKRQAGNIFEVVYGAPFPDDFR